MYLLSSAPCASNISLALSFSPLNSALQAVKSKMEYLQKPP